jgi:hypothetical protein
VALGIKETILIFLSIIVPPPGIGVQKSSSNRIWDFGLIPRINLGAYTIKKLLVRGLELKIEKVFYFS